MFLSDEEYEHITGQMRGELAMGELRQELSEWFETVFAMKMFGYICDYGTVGMIRLRIVLWNRICADRMYHNGNLDYKKQKKIADEFSMLCRKYKVNKPYQNSSDIFVCYETIEDEIRKHALRQVSSEIQSITGYDIWKIEIIFGGIHIFFETNEQAERHQGDGVSDLLEKKIMEMISPYDEFGLFCTGIPCVYTSHQTLNEKYDGSMFFYTR